MMIWVVGFQEDNEMLKRELVALWFGIAIITLAGLFPPWSSVVKYPRDGVEIKTFEGYSFITTKPDLVKDLKATTDRSGKIYVVKRHGSLRIDFVRLIIQWVLIATITWGIMVSLRNFKKSKEREK